MKGSILYFLFSALLMSKLFSVMYIETHKQWLIPDEYFI
jgi:hypothetical protein